MYAILVLCAIMGDSVTAMTVTTRRAVTSSTFSSSRTAMIMKATPPPPTPMPDGSQPRFVRQANTNTDGAPAIAKSISKPTPVMTTMVIPFKFIRIFVVTSVLFLAGYFADLASVQKEWVTLGKKVVLSASTLTKNMKASWATTLATITTMIKVGLMRWQWYYAVVPAAVALLSAVYTSKLFAYTSSSPRVRTTLNKADLTDATSIGTKARASASASASTNANTNGNSLGTGGKPYTVISAPQTSSAAAFTQSPPVAPARPRPVTPSASTSSSANTIGGNRSNAQPFKTASSSTSAPTAAATTASSRGSSQASSVSTVSSAVKTASDSSVTSTTPATTVFVAAGTRASDVADGLFNDIVDVRKVFEKIDSELVADLISPRLYPVIDQVMVKDVRAVRTAKGIPAMPVVYEVVLRARTQVLVRKVIDRVKEDPTQFVDFKSLIASEVAVHDQLIKSLTKRSKRFAVVSGAMLAVVASLIQLFGWLAMDPRWSLTVAGLGFLTEAVFLEQQEEVMTEFAELITSKLLSPQRLWKELTHGPKSAALIAVITQELRAEFSLLIYNTANAGNYREFATKIREALPDAATPSYRHLETVLNVKGYLRTALRRIGSGITQLYGI